MEKTFRAGYESIQLWEKKVTSETLQIVGFSLLALLSLLFRAEEQVRELAWDLDTSVDTVRGWLTVILVACVIFIICSIVIAVDAKGKVEKLKRNYVKLTDEGVFGLTAEGSEFYIEYSDVKEVSVKDGEDENLIIYGKHITYQCAEIASASEAASLIRKKMKGETIDLTENRKPSGKIDQSKISADEPAAEGAVSGETEAYFLNCYSEHVICPFCETKQESNREKCLRCGVDFVFEYE